MRNLFLGKEIRDELEPEILAFFGVKLACEDVALLDGSGKGLPFVVGVGGDDGRVAGAREIRVNVVHVGLAAEFVPDRELGVRGDGTVPAHVRDFEAGSA